MFTAFLKNTKILLLLIIILAGFFRFYALGTTAPSLTWDEVAWGYNAYSLGATGKDEFGATLPYKYLESFGDFKPPLYAYLAIIPVKIWGLTEFATRFPSAFVGILTVFVSYFLTKALFQKHTHREVLGLVTAFLLAISPWHILLSRAAFEANVSTLLLITGVWLFLEAVQRKQWLLLLSATSFVLSLYTFNSARVVAPILVLVLAIGFWKQLWKMKKVAILSALLGLVLLLPTASFLVSSQAQLRFKEVNIFTNIETVKVANQEIANDHNALWSKVIHNRRLAYARDYVQHYFDNLSPDFLFFRGDENPKFSIRTMGQMYVWELLFLFIGIFALFKRREGTWWLIPLWLLIGIIPAAFARETPHALRIEGSIAAFYLFVSYGLVTAYMFAKQKISRPYIFLSAKVCLIFFVLLGLVYFSEQYFVHYPKQYSKEWQYGYKDAVAYMNDNQTKYDKIFLSDTLGRPYIYLLFYTKYDPQKFREDADIKRDVFGFVHVDKIAKFYFDKAMLNVTPKEKVLYIDSPESVPPNAQVLKNFLLLNGQKVLVAYTIK